MTIDVDLADPRAVAYHSEITVTPALARQWTEWKNDYVENCMKRWIEQGTSRDEALQGGAAVMVELSSIDEMPWMPIGHALGVKVEAVLFPGDVPWEGQKRVDFMLACRTLDLCDEMDQSLAAAYQMGISVEQLKTKSPRVTESNDRCALYRHFDRKGVLLYVGISNNPTLRGDQHRASSPWHQFSDEVTVDWFDTRAEADRAERAAIKFERPAFNTNHNSKNRQAAFDYLFTALAGGESA